VSPAGTMTDLTPEIIQRGRGADPEAVARRRQVNSQLRAVREKLTSGSGLERAFDYELLRLFAETHRSSLAAMLLLIVIVGVTCLIWLDVAKILLWMLVAMASATCLALVAKRFLRLEAEKVVIRAWRRSFALSALLHGMSWSFLLTILLQVDGSGARTFLLFLALLVTAVTVMLSFNVPMSVYAGILPVTAVITGNLVASRAGIEWTAMVAIAVGCQLYFAALSNRLYHTTIATLEFRAEKDALIAELEQAKANSDEARRRAEEANVAKSHFLATMSHELRTPLNAILGFSEVMKSELFGQHQVPAYREYSNDIHASGKLLLDIINEILDLSRIEAGRYELKEEAVNLVHIVDDCRHMLQMRARARSITIKEAVEKDLPRLWADERAVRQIALNLLSNAIKFTPQGGEVTLKVGWTATAGQYFSVKDNGPGIPEDEIPVVLQSFGRGSLAIKTAEQGTGLGLPIVKGLVDMHGGTLTLNSVLREGTEVVVTFPASRVMDTVLPVSGEQDGPAPPPGPQPTLRRQRAA